MDWFSAALAWVLGIAGIAVYYGVRFLFAKGSVLASGARVIVAVIVVVGLYEFLHSAEVVKNQELAASIERNLSAAVALEQRANALSQRELEQRANALSQREEALAQLERSQVEEALAQLERNVGSAERPFVISAARVLPTRIFAGPNQYPPNSFAAYGIVAFPATATTDDIQRYMMICAAYVSTLPFYKEVHAPVSAQMVTVWPIDKDRDATRINGMPRDNLCGDAVHHYGLVTAQQAINDAKRSRALIDGPGPFLLAWSPSGRKGVPDALVSSRICPR